MSHQFKPGDLALTLIEGMFFPTMSQVEIVSAAVPEAWFLVRRDGKRSVYHQRDLMPLRGDFNPEQQKAKQVEPCA